MALTLPLSYTQEKRLESITFSSITFAWWQQAQDSVGPATRRGLNTLIILGSWIL